jgi:hypothetical protein
MLIINNVKEIFKICKFFPVYKISMLRVEMNNFCFSDLHGVLELSFPFGCYC